MTRPNDTRTLPCIGIRRLRLSLSEMDFRGQKVQAFDAVTYT